MALFIPGMPCIVCGQPMMASGDVMMFAAFVANRADPIFEFSDAAIHKTCFDQHPLSMEAKRWHDEAIHRAGPGKRICVVCGAVITEPDDYFGTGLLSHDASSPLFEYNFVHLHRSHAARWSGLHKLQERIAAAHSSGTWQGSMLRFGSPPTDAVRWISDEGSQAE